MVKRLMKLAAALVLTAALSGCSAPKILQSTENLYSLPKVSTQFTSLQNLLQELQDAGMEYAPPLTGTNTQPVQLVDLDGDGEYEAMAFLRDTTAEAAPLKIYIFRKNQEDEFEDFCIIEGEGNDINSVRCCQLAGGGDSSSEIVVSWQLGSAVYAVSAYSVETEEPSELMEPTAYTRYCAVDLDEDGSDELVLMNVDNSDESSSSAVYYLYNETSGRMEVVGETNLSNCVAALDRPMTGVLADDTPAVYISGSVLDQNGNGTSKITDILVLQDGALCNITMDRSTGASEDTLGFSLTDVADINSDGVPEVPVPFGMHSGSEGVFYGIDWKQYSGDSTGTVVMTTYYNSTDGWYLEMPESWRKLVRLSRQDLVVGSTNERGVVFSYDKGQNAGTPFMIIYKNTGTNRERRSAEGGRIELSRDDSAIYSVELLESAVEPMCTAEELTARFHQIEADWSVD